MLPERAGGQSVPDVLDLLEERGLRRGAATPDHWVHVAPGGAGGSACPAVEPQETGLTEPWPPGGAAEEEVVRGQRRGGRHRLEPAVRRPTRVRRGCTTSTATTSCNGPDLRPYAGHGTFIAGVVRCVAPETTIFVEGFAIGGVGGGGILESDLVVQLEEALDHDPQVINLSAGCRTRDGPARRSRSRSSTARGCASADCVLVAAAGNDSWAAPFWPAAFDWCVGVGSLDRDGRVSDFSNFGVSADVYALGRNQVNAFPDGTFVCHETPRQGRRAGVQHRHGPVERYVVRRAGRGRADRPRDLRDRLVGARTPATRCWPGATYDSDPMVGPAPELRQPYGAEQRSELDPAAAGRPCPDAGR